MTKQVIFEEPYNIDVQSPWDLAQDCGLYISRDKDFYAGILVGDPSSETLAAAVFTTTNPNAGSYSFDICVSDEYRRRGYGAELMDLALDQYEEFKDIFPNLELYLDAINPISARMLQKRGLKIKQKLPNRVIIGLTPSALSHRVARLHLQAGAPQRARQRKAREIYNALFDVRYKPRLENAGRREFIQAPLRLDLKPLLDDLKAHPLYSSSTLDTLHVYFQTYLPRQRATIKGYYQAPDEIYVLVSAEEIRDLHTTMQKPRVRSVLIHEITHFLDDQAGALWTEGYDSADRSRYHQSTAELDATLSEISDMIISSTKRDLRDALQEVKAGAQDLNSLLFNVHALLGWDQFYLKRLFEGEAPILQLLPLRQIKKLKALSEHLREDQKQRFMKKLWMALEGARREELIPMVANVIRDHPELLEQERPEDYSYLTIGPGRKGPKVWWRWLLSQGTS